MSATIILYLLCIQLLATGLLLLHLMLFPPKL